MISFHLNHLFKDPVSKDILMSWGLELQHKNWGGDAIQAVAVPKWLIYIVSINKLPGNPKAVKIPADVFHQTKSP